jgi:2-haloalkanoic acid dehalogenase type II
MALTRTPSRPRLFTFDVFGTVLDWRTGMMRAAAAHGRPMTPDQFEDVIDAQSALQQGAFRPYAEITTDTLISVLGLPDAAARSIGETLGEWPPYPDSPDALRRLMRVAPSVAMTNSDRIHGEQAQRGLGLRLSDWVCAEEVRVYKPSPDFWRLVSTRLGVPLSADWWHVSAYADYDLGVARELGLTTVFVRRPHARPGPADLEVPDLAGLADVAERLA